MLPPEVNDLRTLRPVGLDSSCLSACFVGQALDGMCVGMVITNAAGRVVWMNRNAERMLGIARDKATGQLFGQVAQDPNFADFWHKASTSEQVVMAEITTHWPEERTLRINASRCLDPAGECIGRALLFCDVTEDRELQLHLSRDATYRLLEMASGWNPPVEELPHAGLTAQELRILRMVGSGSGNEEIARAIHIATSTVRTHLKHVYAKLGLTSRAEAISYALRHGLV